MKKQESEFMAAYGEVLDAQFAELSAAAKEEPHRFSEGFEKRMKELFQAGPARPAHSGLGKRILLAAAALCLAAAAVLAICPGRTNARPIYTSPNVEVRLTKAEAGQNVTNYQWIVLDEETIRQANTVVLKGRASNVRQAEVKYRFMDADVTDNITLFDLKIEKTISCKTESFPDKDTVTIGVGYNANNYSVELPLIREGADYLLFCYVASDAENDPLELAGYVDCWVPYPKDLICEDLGGSYLVYDLFAEETLLQQMGLTELDCDELSNIDPKDDAELAFFVETHCRLSDGADAEAVCRALRALLERGPSGSGLRMLLDHASVLSEEALENRIVSLMK